MEKPLLGWAFGRGQKQGREGEQKHARGGHVSPWRGNTGLRGSTTAFELFFATLVKTSPELMRLWQHKQPEATGTFLVQGGKRNPELGVLPSFLTVC